jgi:hypothetical protein
VVTIVQSAPDWVARRANHSALASSSPHNTSNMAVSVPPLYA